MLLGLHWKNSILEFAKQNLTMMVISMISDVETLTVRRARLETLERQGWER